MSDFETLLKKAKKFHGDVCPGIVLGTRMTIAGMRELDMNPLERNRDLIVYVEIDRCATDAIQAITGCSLGHRTIKCMNYGKFAATFVDTASGKAVRVSAINKSKADPPGTSQKDAVKNLSTAPEAELFKIEKVKVGIPDDDMPGFPRHRAYAAFAGSRSWTTGKSSWTASRCAGLAQKAPTIPRSIYENAAIRRPDPCGPGK